MARNFLEFCERAYSGPTVEKDDFDMDVVVMKTREIVDEFQLTWDSNIIIPEDAELLTKVFNASQKLLLETGLYNLTTKKVMKIYESEMKEALANAPKQIVMGEGKDARVLYARSIEDERAPLIWAGNPGCPTPEHLFLPTVKSWLQEPVVDLITCGSLTKVDGFDVRPGAPSEVIAVQREIQLLKQAAMQTGRPGIGMLAAESSITEIGDLSASLRSCDSHLVALFNEMIVDRGNLVRAAHSLETGIVNASLACTMVGGLAGDAPGATISMMASMMAANIACAADYHLCHPIHITNVATTARGCMWLQSVLCQSFAQNSPSIIVCDVYPKSGALTKELLYEVSANALCITVSGGHVEGAGAADGNAPNGTGLEVRLMGEVAKAATRQRLTRSQANTIVLKLLEKYEHVFKMPNGNPGVQFDVAYNMATLKPVPEWENMYNEVKEELIAMGLSL